MSKTTYLKLIQFFLKKKFEKEIRKNMSLGLRNDQSSNVQIVRSEKLLDNIERQEGLITSLNQVFISILTLLII